MAHFFVPDGVERKGYDIDNKLAPGSVWRMQVTERSRKLIAIYGKVPGMKIVSNNRAVVDEDNWTEQTSGATTLIDVYGSKTGTSLVQLKVGSSIWATLQVQVVAAPASAEHVFIVRDVRLGGWRPNGDLIEVNFDTPLSYIIDVILARSARYGGNLRVVFMAHGLPGFVQCGMGSFTHPTAGPGITVADMRQFDRISGKIKQISFYSCLVARIGTCAECGGHVGYDGNELCYILAQRTQAKVRASIHLQYYSLGNGKYDARWPDATGITFGQWNGTVFTWGPAGNIISTQQFPYRDRRWTGQEIDD